MDASTRIIDLTVGELQRLIAQEIGKATAQTAKAPTTATEQPLYGIEGMAQALHCSKRQAQQMKSAGLLEGGYQQIGRSIIVRSAQTLRDIAERSLQKKRRRTSTNK